MIIIKIKGGLGNQMFQYAYGRALANQHNTELVLDTKYYIESKKRDFLLDSYNTRYRFATSDEIKAYKPSNKAYKRFCTFIQKILPVSVLHYYVEEGVSYKPFLLNLPNNTYIDGYFPSINYFSSIEKEIKKEFTLKNLNSLKSSSLFLDIKNNISVSIHVRRGDYTKIEVGGKSILLPLEYYTKAISYISGKFPEAHFFVFSDDIEWSKENIKTENLIYFVGPEHNLTAPQELFLMSECKHNIIANSTFSFWAGYLNQNKDKMVISPKDWQHDTDPTLDGWIRI